MKEIKIESYSGRKNVYKRVQKMIDESKSIIRIMTTENGIIRMYKIREKSYSDALLRGIKLKIALPITKENIWFVQKFIKMGADIRHLPDVARNRFLNSDSRQLITHFTSQDDREIEAENDFGAWTDSTELAEFTSKFFDNLWDKLETFKDYQKRIKYGSIIKIFILFLFFIIIAGCVYFILLIDMSPKVIALICGLMTSIFVLLGSKLLSLFKK